MRTGTVLAVTVLTDRRVITQRDTLGSTELVIDCTPCRNIGNSTEFVLAERCSSEQSAAWADRVHEHFKQAHR